MIESIVVLLLATLPMTGETSLDRGALVSQAGCEGPATITVAEDRDRGWVVLVRCHVSVVPTADILRAEPWDPARHPRSVPITPGG